MEAVCVYEVRDDSSLEESLVAVEEEEVERE